MGLGVDGDASQFDMTAFALRNTISANGVSQLHGRVANETWAPIIDHPILGITNGVHPPTWVGRPMRKVLQELGGDLDHQEREREADRFWERMNMVTDERPLAGTPAAESDPPGVRPHPAAPPAGPPRRVAGDRSPSSATSSTRRC